MLKPLVHQRGERNAPAVIHRAETLTVGHAQIGEKDFVEPALPVRLFDRTHLDARRMHVDPEHGEPLVLGDRRIRARDKDAVVGMLRRCPDFLPIDHPFVALLLGAGARARKVGAGRRLVKTTGTRFSPEASGGSTRIRRILSSVASTQLETRWLRWKRATWL